MAVSMEVKSQVTTRVLLVEDEPGDARLIRYMLRCINGHTFEFAEAGSLDEAFMFAERDSFDVVLLDLSLPDSSGLATVKAAQDRLSHLPIIVMTGMDDDVLAVHAVKAGAQDYVRKGETDSTSLFRCIRYAVERKRTEKLLSERNQSLADTNDDLRRLTFALTHDMQTPLAGLTGMVEAFRRHAGTGLDSDCARWLARIDSSASRMTRMLDELRLYANANQEATECVDVKLDEIVTEVIEELEDAHLTEGVEIERGIHPAIVRADRDALFRALENLLTNAIKHNSCARKRVVTIDSSVHAWTARIRISDNGPGIPPNQLSRMFLPFTRGKQTSPGTGLGLAIVRRHIERMGGRTWLDSDGKHGTTAVLELPVAGAEASVYTSDEVAA